MKAGAPVETSVPAVGRLTRVGMYLSLVYGLSILAYIAVRWRSLFGMAPNELADFLAGVFGPLAFLWLVLGFFQQGAELRNSAQALHLQAEELRHSVEQQAALVGVTREQLEMERLGRTAAEREADRLARPHFVLTGSHWTSGGEVRSFNFELENLGAACTDVEILADCGALISKVGSMPNGVRRSFALEHAGREELSDKTLHIRFLDARRQPGEVMFLIPVTPTNDGLGVYDAPKLLDG